MPHANGHAVAITGIGVVSPFGTGRERCWECVSAGCSGVRAITDFDASDYACRVAAPVPPIDADAVFGSGASDSLAAKADPRRYAKVSLIAVVAAREAWS